MIFLLNYVEGDVRAVRRQVFVYRVLHGSPQEDEAPSQAVILPPPCPQVVFRAHPNRTALGFDAKQKAIDFFSRSCQDSLAWVIKV